MSALSLNWSERGRRYVFLENLAVLLAGSSLIRRIMNILLISRTTCHEAASRYARFPLVHSKGDLPRDKLQSEQRRRNRQLHQLIRATRLSENNLSRIRIS